MNDSELLQQITEQLFEISGLEPSGAKPKLDINTQDDLNLDISEGGLDAMGIYESTEKSITLYEKSISKCAEDLNCDRSALRLIVMIHEAAHFVTHTGLHKVTRLDWENFKDADRADKEGSAESATRLVLEKAAILGDFKPSQLLKIFDDLNNRSPKDYEVWKNEEEHVNEPQFQKKLYKVSKRREVTKGIIGDEDEWDE